MNCIVRVASPLRVSLWFILFMAYSPLSVVCHVTLNRKKFIYSNSEGNLWGSVSGEKTHQNNLINIGGANVIYDR